MWSCSPSLKLERTWDLFVVRPSAAKLAGPLAALFSTPFPPDLPDRDAATARGMRLYRSSFELRCPYSLKREESMLDFAREATRRAKAQ